MSDRVAGHGPSDALLLFVDRLYDAVAARDIGSVRQLLRMRIAMQLPRDVREDALATTCAPRGSFRAPMQLLQFRHRMVQLRGTGSGPATGQLELELSPRSAPPRRHVNSSRRRGGPWKRRGR